MPLSTLQCGQAACKPSWLLCRAGDFANSSAGGKFVTAAGSWLDNPVAVLKADDDTGNPVSAILSLAEPRYSTARRILTFKVG